MTRFLLICAAAVLAQGAHAADSKAAFMKGDAEAGQTKSTVCAACHGANGNSINPEWPNLAGQHIQYTVARLKAYKSGDAVNALMNAQAAMLSEQDMYDLAAYFEKQTVKPGEADPALVDLGSQIYRLGNEDSNVASCAACHGPKGKGNPVAMMPALAGQRATYTVGQLKMFANGTRGGGINNMMHGVAKEMTEEEMNAVASYIEGLH